MTSPRWLTARQERAWRRYRRMRTLLDLQIARDLNHDSGLSETDYDVLSTLSEKPGSQWRARDLAAQLLWSTSRLAHHLGRMEQRGLVRRDECATDSRGAEVVLTDAGSSAFRRSSAPHLHAIQDLFVGALTPAQLAAVEELTTTLSAHLERAS